MCFEELKTKALSLPLSPGVYIMKNQKGEVIYVGKAKKLKNRVSQYFQNSASHAPKTKKMVSNIDNFDVIVAASEFEALVLECSLIKRHLPKYNILLKDDKGYPYIKINMKELYPSILLVNRIADDGADYYGPFGSRSTTRNILDSIKIALALPTCNRKFPRDIDKQRPCLNYHMNQCAGWCRAQMSSDEYRVRIEQAMQLLMGNYKTVVNTIREQMQKASEELNFELAASFRDRIIAIEALGRKQLVAAASTADTDVIGYQQIGSKVCFAVLHFCNGNLIDKDYEILTCDDDPETVVSALIKQYYLQRGFTPKFVLLPFEIHDRIIFQQLLEKEFGKKTTFKIPQRGLNAKLLELANQNALEEVMRATDKEERISGAVTLLGKMLAIEPPKRIEAYDISNISGTDIVSAMIVFQNGKPQKSEYRHFKIKDLSGQDDYASMRQTILRRFENMQNGVKGFTEVPDLILIDGGAVHAKVAMDALNMLELNFHVFGMVKDDRHRTRALVTQDGFEIRIDAQQSVYSLVGAIQEETHRFAITYHRKLRSARLKFSELDSIPGIGPKRKQMLLKKFQSLSAIGNASDEELERILPKNVVASVRHHFNTRKKGG